MGGGIRSWRIELKSSDCRVKVWSERGTGVYLHLAPLNEQIYFSISALIYYITNENEFISTFSGNEGLTKKQQFKRLARLLEQYLDDILPYLTDDFEKNREELLRVAKIVTALEMERYY